MHGNHYLVCEFAYVAGSNLTDEDCRSTHGEKNILYALEDLRFTANHYGHCSVYGLRLSTAHRSIQKFNAFFCCKRAHLPGNHRRDGTHVDNELACCQTLKNSVLPGNHADYMR